MIAENLPLGAGCEPALKPRAILRISTAGSVDDGKSSLIGRLLYDTKSIFEDQLKAIESASARRGSDQVELALLTDGLRAEREQNITIDVAYRYFSTPRRKFIIADTPGHEQYTRNMVTGTSTSELSIILLDARKGVLPQSRRHLAISALLGIRQIVVAVNKMDLVEFSQETFRSIRSEFETIAARLGLTRLEFIPISALLGDNVVERSASTPWYHGPSLLEFLEEVEILAARADVGLRLPVQYVIRPDQDFRGLAGRIESGSIAPGDRVRVLPSGRDALIAEVKTSTGNQSASEGRSVVVTLDRHLDVSRGEMIVDPESPPELSDRFEAIVAWMSETPLKPGQTYVLLHAQRAVRAQVVSVPSKIDVATVQSSPAQGLESNDLGSVVFQTSQPLFLDPYRSCRATGSFALVDPATNVTVGAGMVEHILAAPGESKADREVFRIEGELEQAKDLAARLARHLRSRGGSPIVLDAGEIGALGEIDLDGLATYLSDQAVTPILVTDGEALTLFRRKVTSTEWTRTPVEPNADLEQILGEPWHPDI